MENTSSKAQELAPVKENEPAQKEQLDFKFFKNCAASLKRFSIIIFVINLFFSIAIIGFLIVMCALYAGLEMLSLLALPIITLFVILVVISRFISALIYGFGVIVEKNEKK